MTIYPAGEHGPEAEVVAKVADPVAFATNDNAARKGDDRSFIAVVTGTYSHFNLLTHCRC